jgi:hypothetical protein
MAGALQRRGFVARSRVNVNTNAGEGTWEGLGCDADAVSQRGYAIELGRFLKNCSAIESSKRWCPIADCAYLGGPRNSCEGPGEGWTPKEAPLKRRRGLT